MMPSEMGNIISSALGGQRGNPIMDTLKERSERAFALVERRLGEAPYFAGNELTAADVMMLFPLSTMRAFAERDLSPLPNIRVYLKQIGERPAYRNAIAKADPGLSPILS